MPVGQFIMPGLRQGGAPWELVTAGLGTGGVQPGGQFKKNNPGCTCCEDCNCQQARVFFTVSGFEVPIPDPNDCQQTDDNYTASSVSVPQQPVVPSSCGLAREPNCWFSTSFQGPFGATWYWEIGLNGDERETNGWILVIHLFRPSTGEGLWWTGPLPGGYIDYTGPLHGLNFLLTQADLCQDDGYQCPHNSYIIQGAAGCRCGHSPTGVYKTTIEGVTKEGGDCAPECVKEINREFLYDTQWSVNAGEFCGPGAPVTFDFVCDSPDFAWPCSTVPGGEIRISVIRIGYILTPQGDYDVYVLIAASDTNAAWYKPHALPAVPWPGILTFGPEHLCFDQDQIFCQFDWTNATLTIETV